MAEAFFILLAAGVMGAVAVPDPVEVTLQWLRLGGMIALTMAGLGMFFLVKDGGTGAAMGAYAVVIGLVLGQLGFVQVEWKAIQRGFAVAAAVAGVIAGTMVVGGNAGIVGVALAGVAMVMGLCLMDMLLGHAYLTAARMTMRPFRRLNLALGAALVARAVMASGGVWAANRWRPVEMLWGREGLYIVTRWLVGLVVPGVFVWMAGDCIKRRATQSATGILYVCGVMVFIGELIGLYLVRETGLPF